MITRKTSLVLVAPAIVLLGFLFLYPLGYSLLWAFRDEEVGGWGLQNFIKAFGLYSNDILFTLIIVTLSTAIIGAFSVAIGGYLTLGENRVALVILRWLYRWPLFIPFVVAAQLMRTFLAKNGMMNNLIVSTGLLEPLQTASFLDWRGIVITFVWKQTPFVALLVAGAMAALDRSTIEAARNLGASRLRILFEIVVPQVATTLMVGLILSYVVMMSVLSVPLMINAQTPTMITVDMAWRINAYSDYGVANALGFISYAMTAVIAWFTCAKACAKGGNQHDHSTYNCHSDASGTAGLCYLWPDHQYAHLVRGRDMVFPRQTSAELWVFFLGARFPPTGQRDGVALELCPDRALHRVGVTCRGDPCGPRFGAWEPSVAHFFPAAVPLTASLPLDCGAYEHCAYFLWLGTERNLSWCGARPHGTGPGVFRLDCDCRFRGCRSRT